MYSREKVGKGIQAEANTTNERETGIAPRGSTKPGIIAEACLGSSKCLPWLSWRLRICRTNSAFTMWFSPHSLSQPAATCASQVVQYFVQVACGSAHPRTRHGQEHRYYDHHSNSCNHTLNTYSIAC